MILVRAAEAAGVGLIVAAGFSLILVLLLLWVGRNPESLCVIALFAGAGIGAAWSLMRRPTLLHAAEETDRQLALEDLLATALLRRDASDPWQMIVLVLADEKCRTLSPGEVMLARLGVRAWGGIGLSAALVLALGALTASPDDSRARATRVGPIDSTLVDPGAMEPAETLVAGSRDPVADRNSGSVETSARGITPERVDDLTATQSASPSAGRQGSTASGGSASARTASAEVPEAGLQSGGTKAIRDVGDAVAGGGQERSSAGQGTHSQTSDGGKASTGPSKTPQADAASGGRGATAGIKRPEPAAGVADQYRDVARRYFGGD